MGHRNGRHRHMDRSLHNLLWFFATPSPLAGKIFCFSDKSWLHYDIVFRKEAAASGSTDWSRMHPDLYNFHTRSLVTPLAASGSSTFSVLSLTEPLASSGNPRSSQYCHSTNDQRCRWPFVRRLFRHSCETCHRDHPCIHCPHRSARRERSRSPSGRHGGGPLLSASPPCPPCEPFWRHP